MLTVPEAKIVLPIGERIKVLVTVRKNLQKETVIQTWVHEIHYNQLGIAVVLKFGDEKGEKSRTAVIQQGRWVCGS